MNREIKIVVTGGAGFIGSVLLGVLNKHGFGNLIVVDTLNNEKKKKNLEGKKFSALYSPGYFLQMLEEGDIKVDFIFHLGAKTNATEADYQIQKGLNVDYPERLWNCCVRNNTPFVYASSASTYGSGEKGFLDNESEIEQLKPLSSYGKAKNEFDIWVLRQDHKPSTWAGLKIFNVFGPNEYHKERKSSVVLRSFFEIREAGVAHLFGSHQPSIENGGHTRDFIYVKDVAGVCLWFLEKWQKNSYGFPSGIFNVGTGVARSYNDLARAVFNSMHLPENIKYIFIPEDLRPFYPDHICADIQKLRLAGYSKPMYSLEDAVEDYVKNYLLKNAYF